MEDDALVLQICIGGRDTAWFVPTVVIDNLGQEDQVLEAQRRHGALMTRCAWR